jgi:hypothetical protein
MATPTGKIEIVNRTIDSVFTNTAENDMVVYPSASTQSIHLGSVTNALSMLKVNPSNVEISGQICANSNDSSNVPSYSWSNDGNTGMYHVANDTIGFSCGGSNVMSLTSNSAAFSTSNVNFGVSSKSSSGYTMLPNGLLLQWASVQLPQPGSTGNSRTTVNFPIAFSSTPYSVTGNWASGGPNLVQNTAVFVAGSVTASSFYAQLYTPGNTSCDINGAGGTWIYYMAIGPR